MGLDMGDRFKYHLTEKNGPCAAMEEFAVSVIRTHCPVRLLSINLNDESNFKSILRQRH